MRKRLRLNREVKFLYQEKFPVFFDDEAHIPVTKILIGDTMHLMGNYEGQDEESVEGES